MVLDQAAVEQDNTAGQMQAAGDAGRHDDQLSQVRALRQFGQDRCRLWRGAGLP